MGDSPHQVTQQEAGTASEPEPRLQKLEEKLADTFHAAEAVACEATSAIKQTVQSATGSVKQAAQSVSRAVDLNGRVQEHPWLVVGGSVALGFLAAQLLKESSHPAPASPWLGPGEQMGGAASGKSAGSGKSVGGLGAWLSEQLGEVKSFAASSIMNYVHALVVHGLDTLQEQVGQRGRWDEDRGRTASSQSTTPLQRGA